MFYKALEVLLIHLMIIIQLHLRLNINQFTENILQKSTSNVASHLKILTPNLLIQRLPITLTQVKLGNTSENLLNETLQIIYFLYQGNKVTKKVYKNITNSIQLQYKMDTIFMNSQNISDRHRPVLNLCSRK